MKTPPQSIRNYCERTRRRESIDSDFICCVSNVFKFFTILFCAAQLVVFEQWLLFLLSKKKNRVNMQQIDTQTWKGAERSAG